MSQDVEPPSPDVLPKGSLAVASHSVAVVMLDGFFEHSVWLLPVWVETMQCFTSYRKWVVSNLLD